MLPIKNRLANRNDFQKVHRDGKFFSANGILMQYVPNGLENSRIGFSVGKKVSKLATERNRTRRILREAVHAQLANLKKGYDIVIIYRGAKKPSLQEISAAIVRMFKKCSLID